MNFSPLFHIFLLIWLNFDVEEFHVVPLINMSFIKLHAVNDFIT
jgi:hypothetical protein